MKKTVREGSLFHSNYLLAEDFKNRRKGDHISDNLLYSAYLPLKEHFEPNYLRKRRAGAGFFMGVTNFNCSGGAGFQSGADFQSANL